MEQSFPTRNTHPASLVRFRINSSSSPVIVYCSMNFASLIRRNLARCSISRSARGTSVTRQHSAHWRQSMASCTSWAVRRKLRSTQSCDFKYLRNCRFSSRFFSPRRLICTRSVSTLCPQLRRHVLPPHLDLAFVLHGLGEIIGDLHSQPSIRRAAERFG